MIKQFKKTLIVTSIITLLPILAGLILWERLPETIATHFGADNQANGWSSKWFAVFGLPLILLAAEWFCMLVTSIDPKRKNINRKALGVALWIMPIISLISSLVIYAYAFEIPIDIGMIMFILLGVTFVLLGNYMPKTQQNYSLGIKLPWTLNDEDNWRATHRLAGFLWTLGGIIILISAIFKPIWLLLSVAVLMILLPTLYSYLYYKKNKKADG